MTHRLISQWVAVALAAARVYDIDYFEGHYRIENHWGRASVNGARRGKIVYDLNHCFIIKAHDAVYVALGVVNRGKTWPIRLEVDVPGKRATVHIMRYPDGSL